MKKLLLLSFFLLLFLVGCFYESEYIGATIEDKEDGNILLGLLIRDKENKNNITVINYSLNTNLTPISIDGIYKVNNATNILSKNYIVEINNNNAYLNIQIKTNNDGLFLNDWNNEEHYLKYIGYSLNETDCTHWTHALYWLAMINNAFTNYNNIDEYLKETTLFDSKEDFNTSIKKMFEILN